MSSLIFCANGCGDMLSFERLRTGWRGPSGVKCEACAVDLAMRQLASEIGLTGDQAEVFVMRAVTWIMDQSPATRAETNQREDARG